MTDYLMKDGHSLYDFIDPRVDFTLVRDVKAPTRAHANDAGADWYVPNGTEEFRAAFWEANKGRENVLWCSPAEDGQFEIKIFPHARVKIPSGIKVNIHDKDTYLAVDNKSGISNNKGLIFTADVIDADYRGECNLCVANISNEVVSIKTGEKLVQVIQRVWVRTAYNCISNEEFDHLEKTDRGEGGFNSTGLK